MATTYKTLDDLPDLTNSEISTAEGLAWEKASADLSIKGWNNMIQYSREISYSLEKPSDIFQFQATEGATYKILTLTDNMIFAPVALTIYDNSGNAISVKEYSFFEDAKATTDPAIVIDLVAPYTGNYFIDAGWTSSLSFVTSVLVIVENLDEAVNTNHAPTGEVKIKGIAKQGQILTAISSTLADEDGLGDLEYQWFSNDKEIDGATLKTYKITTDDIGNTVSVKGSYIDGEGTAESVTSKPTEIIVTSNNVPTGEIAISGIAKQEQTLSVKSTLEDKDGLGNLKYQWLSDNEEITGATLENYKILASDIGKMFSVKVNYVDGKGTAESVTSKPTAIVTAKSASKNDDLLIGTRCST